MFLWTGKYLIFRSSIENTVLSPAVKKKKKDDDCVFLPLFHVQSKEPLTEEDPNHFNVHFKNNIQKPAQSVEVGSFDKTLKHDRAHKVG